jgi:hypothetical protein
MLRPGWGVSFATTIEAWAGGKWYLQTSVGRAISRYYHDLGGRGLDLLFNPDENKAYLPFSFGASATYEHHWSENIYSNFTYGLLNLQKEAFTPEDTYHFGENFRFNSFWNIVDGARVGIEYIHARKTDKAGETGTANRVNVLVYYDF